MLNNYTSNYIQIKKTYNQINPEKIQNPSYQNKQRASSTNIDKMKSQAKVLPYNSTIKKTNNQALKSISVNKQIQYQKKNLSKNNIKNTENVIFTPYNGILGFKSNYNNNANNNKISKCYINVNNNTNPKNERASQINNYSNNKLRRKMILSVDINNKLNGKNISQNDLNNNIKYITDVQSDNNNLENNPSNPMSNGAKNNEKKTNTKNNISKMQKSISVNNITKNWSQNNLMKSPDKKYASNILTKYIEISDKKERNSKNNNNNMSKTTNININIKQSLKALEQQNNSNNLILKGNYQSNLTTGNNEKKYIKPNLKNSNASYYKINHNQNSKYNIYENNNAYKIMKDIVEIQTDMEKKLKNNVTNSKSKKYNTLKNTFETLLKYLGNSIFKSNNVIVNILLEKLLIGYHEVVSAFSAENKKLKQINYNLNEQYEKMSKDLFNSNKIIKEKQKQIENLQRKISSLEKGINKKNIIQNQKINNIKQINLNIGENDIKKNDQNLKIFELNKKNIGDLDALYFYDKIKDNKKRAVSIPKIIIKQKEEEQNEEEEEEDEYENDEMNQTVICSNICGIFVGLGDIKFTSQTFIKIRDAFII